jgi:hypothetical protein
MSEFTVNISRLKKGDDLSVLDSCLKIFSMSMNLILR